MLLAYLIVAALLAGLAAWVIALYNRLVRDRNNVAAGWSDIDVQLQRRHDLIPNLVETVKTYSDYEQATMTAVTELRTQSQRETHPAQKARIEQQLQIGLDRLLAVAESYPDLKANQNFIALQKELSNTEDKLEYARRYYNGAVRTYNTRQQTFPDSFIAQSLGLREAEYFEADEQARKNTPVDFGR